MVNSLHVLKVFALSMFLILLGFLMAVAELTIEGRTDFLRTMPTNLVALFIALILPAYMVSTIILRTRRRKAEAK